MKERIKFFIISLPVCILLVLILVKPSASLSGGINGILTVGNILIPSLLPFTALALFLQNSGIIYKAANKINSATRIIFNLNGIEFCTFFLSLIGGYPVGIKLISNLLNENIIDENKARKMSLYCINAGPSFILTAIGVGIYNNKITGIILLIGNTVGALLTERIIERKRPSEICKSIKKHYSISDALTVSVANASAALISLGGWVVVFSSLLSVLKTVTPQSVFEIICDTCEITNSLTVSVKPIYISAFLIGYGGLSVHCQILSIKGNVRINYPIFLLARIFHGLVSAVTVFILTRIIRPEINVFSNFTENTLKGYSSTFPFAVVLISLSIILILSIGRRKENKQKLL